MAIRDLVGAKVGWAGRTADKALMAARLISILESSDNQEDILLAEKGMVALNKNPSAGYEFAKEVVKQKPELKQKLRTGKLPSKKLLT